MRRCGVLGSPIAHSLSPVLHRAAYVELGLDWTYDAYDVDETALPAFLAQLAPPWRGLSLTMPLKQAAVGLCTRLSDRAARVGAVNTVLVEDDGELVGSNTDIPGFTTAWREAGIARFGHVVIVGAGATSRSALAALGEVGVGRVTVLARAPERASGLVSLADRLNLRSQVLSFADVATVDRVDLVVSTVPAVADDPFGRFAAELVAKASAVCDVVYSPRRTAFTEAARQSGLPCAEGFDLLVHQAARQVELMTEAGPAPLAAMRAAGLAELDRRAGADPPKPQG